MGQRKRTGLVAGALAGAAGLMLPAPLIAAGEGGSPPSVGHGTDEHGAPFVTEGADTLVFPRRSEPGATTGQSLLSSAKVAYPPTRRDNLIERSFGEDIADPYRWLEGAVRSNADVADWVARQNTTTAAYIAQLPGRNALAMRIRSLFDCERFGIPRKAGGLYFYRHNTGLQNQSTLMVRKGLTGRSRVLIDPAAWDSTGRLALDGWSPSRNGRRVAITVQEAGSDWRTIRIVDVKSGRMLGDMLRWANETRIDWVGDEGVLYSRYPVPDPGQEHTAPAFGKAVWFHKVGTPQDADELVYDTPDHREWGHKAAVTSDGRWAVITTEASTLPRRAVHVIDLAGRDRRRWRPLPVVSDIRFDWKLVDGQGDRLWFITNDGAPNYRLVRLDLGDKPRLAVVVPERSDTLEGAQIVGDRLILSYLRDGQATAVVTDQYGRPVRALTVNSIGSASGFAGRPGDPETFYQYSSFNQPLSIYRLDIRNGKVTPFAVPKPSFDPTDYAVEQRSYTSRDGTRVPIYIVRKRVLAEAGMPLPTLLYGYGGFDMAMTPSYSPVRMAWLEAGGAFALPQIRGGGEFGRAWYDAGRLDRKHNSFDDFIAAGEYLIHEGIARPDGLAIQGGSNGGMMVAAVVNQRPDLFAAANPDVGVMDMLRFDRFTQGRFWTDDYGNPQHQADWKVLRTYSPYHNIRAARYPAILVTTADTDDRVVPAHSFKYVAALQAASLGDRPRLLRVEGDAGHGPGRSLDKAIASGADVLAFLAYWTGLTLP